ncbi:dephospho-CoA kinase [Lactobacillus sp. ESL0731]|uniref:dephospho-CoA kinase n=1 Tax=unclassified Lactobacillus TaxID=2620435 RepID=UPI0023F9512A|nr:MULTISPECIES: dephospho-CoA kinase [unclassified Lactobacillus]WEV50568.1 dephospho-CoA kinase [Lactobacillus sp. ESL0700]WEV61698.1 dephospho-CoA kinase [Lactobacillus sp. ESL0731]
MTLVLGLTGGIASGKSTADAFFRKQGLPIIDSDLIAHQILNVGEDGYLQVVQHFGKKFLNPDQTINRHQLGKVVFSNPEQLKILNKITHPLIFQTIQAKITQNKQAGKQLIIVDAPVLFESGGQKYCDQTLLIAIPEEMQIERLMQRDQLTRQAALNRIKSQMPLAQKIKLADYVVTNTGTIEELEAKLAELLLKLKGEKNGMS